MEKLKKYYIWIIFAVIVAFMMMDNVPNLASIGKLTGIKKSSVKSESDLKDVPARNRIIDNAGLIKASEIENIKKSLDKIASVYDFELVIVTEKSIGNKDPVAYADDFFDYNGYGITTDRSGSDRDGCLFLIVMGSGVEGERDYCFSTSGRGIRLFDYQKAAADKLEKSVVKRLKEEDWAGAFLAFIGNWEEFLDLDTKGRSYNFFYKWDLILIIVSIILSFIAGSIIVNRWKRDMDTAIAKTEADIYIVPGSLSFTKQQDNFLYSRVTKTERPKSSSGSGGGIHTSSSGRSHGGRSGKF